MTAQLHSAMARVSPALALFVLTALYLVFDTALLSLFAPGNDWAPIWTAGRLAWDHADRAYDSSLVTSMQQPLLGVISERPFVYPPTALLLFAPLAILPFRLSLVASMLSSLLLLEKMSSKLGARPILLAMSPPVFLAAIAGQPTLFTSALLIAAIVMLPASEYRAGALLAICAVIKPTLFVFVPLALCAGGHWRALLAAGVTAAILCLLSIVAFGVHPWLAWLTALPKFEALVAGFEPLARNTVTPYATAIRLGISPAATMLVAVPIAIAGAFMAFNRSRDLSIRLVALVGGALLVSPYAMNYELAAFAPAIAAVSVGKWRDIALPAIWGGCLLFNASLLGLLAVYLWAAAKLIAGLRQPDRIDRCTSGSILPPEITATVPSAG